jgi:molybdopterin synthase catalytic subunit
MGNQNRLIFIPMRLKNIFNEVTASEVIKDLDKVKNDLPKKVDVLVAKKKKLYSNVDIESPMSADEKKLDKEIADLFSDINQLVLQKRSLKKESVNEGLYFVGYNKGRGQGTGVFKDSYSSYKDAKKAVEKIEKERGGSYNQIAYYVADEKGNFVREAMLGEGRGVKTIQSDFNKTVAAIETELLHYKKTKGTPQEKKHVDNLKKLHPIKKKLEAELESAVSGLYRDAELKIED